MMELLTGGPDVHQHAEDLERRFGQLDSNT
jgi:hypothetical protein